MAVNGPGLCLPMCVLAERVLAQLLPAPRFSLQLGSLQIEPEDENVEATHFDPRGPKGIDGGFHAWLEDTNGQLIDPSIFLTLHVDGYNVDPQDYILVGGRNFVFSGLRFIYEEVPELELLGLAESEARLSSLMPVALYGEPAPPPEMMHLDVGWRDSRPPPT